MHALIASGSGRYADPWHPFPRTSPLIADVLREAGFVVDVDEDVDAAMTRLDGIDLLVVNAADPWRDTDERLAPGAPGPDALAAALHRGMGVLAFHSAVASLRDYPDWAAALGGMWVPGASGHPPLGEMTVSGATLPDGGDVPDFTVTDERYLSIQRIGRSHVVATHEGAQGPESSIWVREYGRARVAVDLLGHDERSYHSSGHRDLIVRLARWAARADDDPSRA